MPPVGWKTKKSNCPMMLTHLSTLIVASAVIATSAETSRPNIVILFADNLGYADISLFGAPSAQTPNIDRLGMEGIKLNNWNSAAHLCSASRASLLTGKYSVRTGVYPGVFKPDAVYGMLPSEITIAEYLKEDGYATSIVGKWHLGHRPEFLPTNQGFDDWLGVPYHMSGGSLDNHTCAFDLTGEILLPLYQDQKIIQQPVKVEQLAARYATRAQEFIKTSTRQQTPFFLYLPFSHVHQLCAPRDQPEQQTCQWNASGVASFTDAVEEMDWITGQVLEALDESGAADNTLVLFTSDNGPWVAEQSCSGFKGPFEGRWLRDNVDLNCTACPGHDYIPDPTTERPRRCSLPGTDLTVDGVHCGEDTGLGSVWEANLRMPAVARWPEKIAAGTETMTLVSTLDVLPTVLSLLGKDSISKELDGIDISAILFGQEANSEDIDRVLFFWRDGFRDGPLGPPYGRFDVVAAKVGRIKVWFSTKSAHYNNDVEVHHDPPLLFDILTDPAEAYPLDPNDYTELIDRVRSSVQHHKESVDWTYPLALARDPAFIPCADKDTGCRIRVAAQQPTTLETLST